MTALGLVAILALILAQGYFVAAEFSYVAARRSRLEELASEGNRNAERALWVLSRLSFVLSGAQLGITVTSLVVGYLAEYTLGAPIRPLLTRIGVSEDASFGIAVTVAFFLATAAQMVFGELGPKNLAVARPEPLALGLARITVLYTRVTGPVIRVFDSASNWLLRRFGIEPVEEISDAASPEELTYLVEEAGREGALTEGQAALLSRALDFRNLRAVDAMVPRPHVVALEHDATCEDLRRLAVESGYSRFPITGGNGLDEVLGVVLARDVLRVPVDQRATTSARSLSSVPIAVPESASLSHLLTDLRDANVQLAVVVDEYGGTAGIVTLEDIVEELVGDIEDEYDVGEPRLERRPDGSSLVPGAWRIDEVVREVGFDLPEGDYETLGGLVMAELGRIPRVGDVVQVDGAVLRVEEMDGLAVGLLRIGPGSAKGASNGESS
jgi:CBS domain containing-hemolysin-like protein